MSFCLGCGREDKFMNRERLEENESRSAAHQPFNLFWSPSI